VTPKLSFAQPFVPNFSCGRGGGAVVGHSVPRLNVLTRKRGSGTWNPHGQHSNINPCGRIRLRRLRRSRRTENGFHAVGPRIGGTGARESKVTLGRATVPVRRGSSRGVGGAGPLGTHSRTRRPRTVHARLWSNGVKIPSSKINISITQTTANKSYFFSILKVT